MYTNSADDLQHIRVTLDFEIDGNSFHPNQIDYHALFDINEDKEKLSVTVENLSVDIDTLWEQSYGLINNNWYGQFLTFRLTDWQSYVIISTDSISAFVDNGACPDAL